MEEAPLIGIIGGSGLTEFEGVKVIDRIEMDTPFGKPSDALILTEIAGRKVVFLPRHGVGHRIPPTKVPYRANIWALKKLGVFWCVTISACGSLQQEIAPGHFCIPDQIIDRTRMRDNTFFDELVAHVPFAYPYNKELREVLIQACEAEGIVTHHQGTYVCMEGPAFSTRAESLLYRSWGAHLVGMTALPEAKLAAEAEMAYATIALATDYDCWHESVVDVEEVIKTMQKNIANVHRAIQRLVPMIPLGTEKENSAYNAIACALTTNPKCITKNHRDKYELLLKKYIDFDKL